VRAAGSLPHSFLCGGAYSILCGKHTKYKKKLWGRRPRRHRHWHGTHISRWLLLLLDKKALRHVTRSKLRGGCFVLLGGGGLMDSPTSTIAIAKKS
jgi:hypothetical protein